MFKFWSVIFFIILIMYIAIEIEAATPCKADGDRVILFSHRILGISLSLSPMPAGASQEALLGGLGFVLMFNRHLRLINGSVPGNLPNRRITTFDVNKRVARLPIIQPPVPPASNVSISGSPSC
ncbi:hypothetical protein G9C98_001296 [Cotesia typhae]|uniref:Uncharacterized protein n=1 Tax=Cotesia typhae TaxID=2053667 RepID=A0A8J5QP71_9HYME|nr:hypothetical protein G9C98_001296 [Cotesia typhae]